jgi:hypothetical protein
MAETSPAEPRRPRSAFLALLAVALGALVVYMLWPAAVSAPGPSNPPREQRRQAAAQTGNGAEGAFNVRLDVLKQAPAAPQEESQRNPFRFYVKPPPAPAPPKPVATVPPPPPPQPSDPGYLPPPPPPIPLKFIGTVEVKGRKVAIFVSTDQKGMPQYAAEGELVLGQYRVVKIGVESVTLEYLDGRGKQIIPMRG